MSKASVRKYICPKCKKEYEITTWDSINVKEDPDLREKSISGDIFHQECPHCHSEYMVLYECLYCDPENRFVVWLDPGRQNNDVSAIGNDLIHQGYILRKVLTITEFVEKIQILEDGVDDKAVELAKYDSFIDYINNRKGNREDVTGISYQNQENGVLKINIKTDDKGLSIMIPYDALIEEMKEHEDMFQADPIFPVINSEWIIQIFEDAQESVPPELRA